MIVLFWLFLIQQFSGIYITLFFAVTFFQVKHYRHSRWSSFALWMLCVTGSGKWSQCVPCVHICGRHSICYVVDECLVAETIQTTSTHHGIVIGYGSVYVCVRIGHLLHQARSNGYWMGKCDRYSCLVHGFIELMIFSGPSRLLTAVRMHLHDRTINDTLDDDSRIVPHRHPRHCPFALVFNGKHSHVCCYSKLQVMLQWCYS